MDIKKSLSTLNQDCCFSDMIKESSYIESVQSVQSVQSSFKPKYYNFLFCILDTNDLTLSSVPQCDKKHYFNKCVLEMSGNLDEKSDIYYDNLFYNEKNMKKNTIQLSLHSCSLNKRYISTVYYLNDLYKTHHVIVNMNKKEYYETTIKNYPKIYLCQEGNRFYLRDSFHNLSVDFVKAEVSKSNFEIDVKNIYNTYLGSISKYKITELREIAKEQSIRLTLNGKNKTKKDLHEEINIYNLNLINV